MKVFFVDLTLCNACRACQTTCNKWDEHPSDKQTDWNLGEFQRELPSTTYKLVHPNEAHSKGKKLEWIYYPEQCNHCDLCQNKVQNGELPACVLACPTGALTFGDESHIHSLARTRLDEVRLEYPKAHLGDLNSEHVIYLFPHAPVDVFAKAISEVNSLTRRELFSKMKKGGSKYN